MVYDASRNFLGDTYWKEPAEIQEGDELTLDKGLMVEVAETMGTTQTDLTPLLERKKESPQRNNARPVLRAPSKPAIPVTNSLRASSQLRHKSLNALLGTSKGPIGKAMPMRSPFETRKEKENHCTEERASKRQKTTQSGAEQRSLNLVAGNEQIPNKNISLSARTSDAKGTRAPQRTMRPPVAAVITLDSEPDSFLSDVTLPSTPPGVEPHKSLPNVTPVAARNQSATRGPQAFATPKIPKGKVPVPHVKALETPRPLPQPSSPPISVSNRLSNVDFALQPAQNRSTDVGISVQRLQHPKKVDSMTMQPAEKPSKTLSPLRSPPRNPRAKSLRLSAGVKRAMLMCQSGPPQRRQVPIDPKRVTQPKETVRQKSSTMDVIHVVSDDENTHSSKLLKSGKITTGSKKKQPVRPADVSSKPEPASIAPLPRPSMDGLDDMELVHGLMDQRLMVTSSPPQPREPTSTLSPIESLARKSKPSAKRGKKAAEGTPDNRASNPKKTLTTTAKKAGAKPRLKKTQPEISQSVQQESPPASPVLAPPEEPFLLPTVSTDECQRTASPSISPTKKATPSTGGFRKKPKHAKLQPIATKSTDPATRTTAVTLPPHPLRADHTGPLMSTTELSALLLKEDPIVDSTQKVSPKKSFQRSRSENDAPIPSMSESWEQSNLSKGSEAVTNVTLPTKPDVALSNPKAGGLAALVRKTDPRRKFQRTQSLNIDTNILNVAETEVLTPPEDHDVGPWSTEAFDLFDWKPPNFEASTGTLTDG
jgi:hypothetical protein